MVSLVKSVIVEKGETLINCLAYIDLNPVRVKIVKKPEDYRWNSIGYHVQRNNKDNFLSLDFGLKEFGELDEDERFRRYRRFVYETGAVDSGKGAKIDAKTVEKERKRDLKSGLGSILGHTVIDSKNLLKKWWATLSRPYIDLLLIQIDS